MKQLTTLLFCLLTTPILLLSQRKVALEKVTTSNKIDNEPYILLPKTAARMNMTLGEFTYTAGDKLTSLITIKDYKCDNEKIKKELSYLETKYGVNTDAIIKLLREIHSGREGEVVVMKLDKQVSTSFIAVADYDKLYKYTGIKSKALNSSLLNLVYDENGVLVSSKQTSESKVFPAIMNTLSGLVGIAGALKGATDKNTDRNIDTSCVKINFSVAEKLDSLVTAYNAALKGSYFTQKQFEEAMKKEEEYLSKEFEELFYGKVTRLIPLQLTFILPGSEKDGPVAGTDKSFDLFAWDKTKQKVILNSNLKEHFLFTPFDRFDFGKPVNPVSVALSAVEKAYNKADAMESFMGKVPEKTTAVYNIPRSERFRLNKPTGNEAYIDTTIKVPQHGRLGYYSMRLSSLELTYDTNGELKSITAESKSSMDTNISSAGTLAKDIITMAKGKSEMDLLKEKADRLELEKKIRDLEKDPDQ